MDARDLENIFNSIHEMINPFDASINKDALFNIKTGRKVSPAADNSFVSDKQGRMQRRYLHQ